MKTAREPSGDTFQATALVHKAWLRLDGSGSPRFENRTHFFGAAAEAMRRILMERARQRLAVKRGGAIAPLDIEGMEIYPTSEQAPNCQSQMMRQQSARDSHARNSVRLRRDSWLARAIEAGGWDAGSTCGVRSGGSVITFYFSMTMEG